MLSWEAAPGEAQSSSATAGAAEVAEQQGAGSRGPHKRGATLGGWRLTIICLILCVVAQLWPLGYRRKTGDFLSTVGHPVVGLMSAAESGPVTLQHEQLAAPAENPAEAALAGLAR